MQFWPALRMNDIHEDDTERFGAFRSTFKKEHPAAADRVALSDRGRVRL